MDHPDTMLEDALDAAARHARFWLDSRDARPVPASASTVEVVARLGAELPDAPTTPAEVIDLLAEAAEPGLTAISSGRFFGFVMGGLHPAGLAADWLVSAWDQNSGLRSVTPATIAAEDVASGWILDLLGLPASAGVGFVTGGTMANFTCLAAARDTVMERVGWSVAERGLAGGPRVRVIVGEERHHSIDLVLRYLGLGTPETVPVDDQGRIRSEALAAALAEHDAGPTIVCLQAGNIHSGAFDPFAEAIEVAHAHGAWVHIDGAFGLFAAASPRLRHLVVGHAAADSWATDAHKTLNVPYDCGIAIVRNRGDLQRAMSLKASYLIQDLDARDPVDLTPETSRRARGVPVWAVLRALGRRGVADLVDGLAGAASAFASAVSALDGARVLNDVVFTQVCVSFGSDERTRRVTEQVIADGGTWMTGSVWRDTDVLRIAVSDHRTGAEEIRTSVAALARAVAAVDAESVLTTTRP